MKQGSEVRIGYISAFDAATGMATVFYPDRTGQVTQKMKIFAPFGAMQMLAPDDEVLVLHLSNGPSVGLVIGKFVGSGASINAAGGEITLSGNAGSITLSELIDMRSRI